MVETIVLSVASFRQPVWESSNIFRMYLVQNMPQEGYFLSK